VLTRFFWFGIDYHVAFDEDQHSVNNLTTVHNSSMPAWATQGDFVSSAKFNNGAQLASAEGLVWVTVTHRYPIPGTRVVKLVVSGQLTMRGPIQREEIAVDVLVRDRPSLRDVIGHVTLASQSQAAYVNESATFVFAVEKVVHHIDFLVDFGDDLEQTVRKTDAMVYFFCRPTQCVGAAFAMATWLSVCASASTIMRPSPDSSQPFEFSHTNSSSGSPY